MRSSVAIVKRVIASCLLLLGLTLGSPVFGGYSYGLFGVEQVEAAVKVKGYFRKDGTYVQPHYRSNPDGNPYNNWSFPGNTNPYTGKTATGNPDTYLKNYYNGGSSYTPSFSVPSYTPSYSIPSITTPTWHSCSEFGIGASYSYLSGKCECNYGYSVRNNRCVSDDDACKEDYGYNSRSTLGGKCECRYGYKFNPSGDKCISNEDYCRELDWNAEYDFLKDSCVCKDGYKASSDKSRCVLDLDTYFPSGSSPSPSTCPPDSYENPLNPTKCICNAGYEVNAAKTACILKTTPSASDAPECPSHMHKFEKKCVCDTGYRKEVGGSCSFDGCPAGYKYTGGDCIADMSIRNKAISCVTRNPCTCPSGYKSMANRKCIPIN